MAIQWYRGGPDFEAARIKTGRELAGMQGIGAGVGGGVRALQRAMQREKGLKQQEAMLKAQMGMPEEAPEATDVTPGEPEAGAEGLAPPEPMVPPEDAGAPPAEEETGDPGLFGGLASRMGGALGALGRVAVGLPAEQGLHERVGTLQGQLAAEQAANEAKFKRMQALSRIGASNPEMLGAVHRAMPGQFPEFPEVEPGGGVTDVGNAAEMGALIARRMAEETRGPGAEPTAAELEMGMDAVRKRFATPYQPHYVEEPALDILGEPVLDESGQPVMTQKVYRAGTPPPASQGGSGGPPTSEPIDAEGLRRRVPATTAGIPLWTD